MKSFITLLLCLAGCMGISAQTDKSSCLFDDFKDAIVYYKDGRGFNVPLNYNLLTGQYIFIDKTDGNREKEFSDPQLIVAIEIGKRTFLPPSEGATEIIQAEPSFYVQYKGYVKRTGKAIPYGGTTQTASVDSYSGFRGSGLISGATTGSGGVVADLDKVYKVGIGKKIKRFANMKQFLKLFPDNKVKLTEYIEENKIDFENIGQVLQLYNYAIALK